MLKTVEAPRTRPIVFMFSGQGTQYPLMADGLYQAEPIFRATIDHCSELLKPLIGEDLRDPAVSGGRRDGHLLTKAQPDAHCSKPALFRDRVLPRSVVVDALGHPAPGDDRSQHWQNMWPHASLAFFRWTTRSL